MKKLIKMYNEKYGNTLGVIDDDFNKEQMYRIYYFIKNNCDDEEIQARLEKIKLDKPKTLEQQLTKLESENNKVSSGTIDPTIKSDIANIKTDLGDEELTTVNKNVKGAINEVNAQYKDIANNKADKNSVFTMANMGQDIKEAMTGGSVAVIGKNTVLNENIVDNQITPSKLSFYYRNSNNLYDITGLNKNYCNNIESINNGIITTKKLSANIPFYLNVNPTTNEGKGNQTLPAGTYYLKYKIKGSSGKTGTGSGVYPPRVQGGDAIRHNFTKISGVNSTDFTEWIWTIDLDTDVVNYGFLFQNGNNEEVYTIKDIMLTNNVDNDYEDFHIYYAKSNIKNEEYESYKIQILENKNSIQNIENKLPITENSKILHCGFIGDSLTEGDYGSLDGSINKHDLNYPYYFKQVTGWTGTNFGKCGWTTKDVWERIVSTMNLGIKYNIFIIMLGTNGGLTDTIDADCNGNDYNNYAETQTGSYCKIVEHIIKNCPTAQIFLCTPPYNNKIGKCEYIVETGNVVKKIAQKYNIQVIDIYHELGINSLNEDVFLPIDKLHFGQYGYNKLGVFLASKIKANLSYYDN